MFRRYRPDDEEAVLRLMKDALGETSARRRNPATWRWKHFENPFGHSHIRVACNPAGDIVGLRAFMRWQFHVNGSLIDAVQAVDTATRPDFQGQGVFSSLTAQALDDVRQDNIRFVFNTPNIASRSGYLRLGWRYVGTVEPLVRVRRPQLFWPQVLLGTLLRRGGAADDCSGPGAPRCAAGDYDRLADLIARHERNVATNGRLRTRWTPEFYRWRYVSQPDVNYRLHTIESGGEITAAAITRSGSRFGLKEVLVSELWTAEASETLVGEVLRSIHENADADYVLAVAAPHSVTRHLLQRHGFSQVWQPRMNSLAEKMLKGYQKPRRLVVRKVTGSSVVDPCQFDSWDLSVGDLEIF